MPNLQARLEALPRSNLMYSDRFMSRSLDITKPIVKPFLNKKVYSLLNMDDHRKNRLTHLIKTRFDGDRAKFQRETSLTKGRVSQLLDPNQPFGERAAQSLVAKLGLSDRWFEAPMPTSSTLLIDENLENTSHSVRARKTPVVGTARMGDNGFYEELGYPTGHGDGWVDNYSSDPSAFALRVKGDSMHPAIRHGSFVVIEPNGQCVPGEYVVLSLKDGRKMVKELVIERQNEIVIESVNGNHRQTIEKMDIEKIQPVAAVVAASKWRPN